MNEESKELIKNPALDSWIATMMGKSTFSHLVKSTWYPHEKDLQVGKMDENHRKMFTLAQRKDPKIIAENVRELKAALLSDVTLWSNIVKVYGQGDPEKIDFSQIVMDALRLKVYKDLSVQERFKELNTSPDQIIFCHGSKVYLRLSS